MYTHYILYTYKFICIYPRSSKTFRGTTEVKNFLLGSPTFANMVLDLQGEENPQAMVVFCALCAFVVGEHVGNENPKDVVNFCELCAFVVHVWVFYGFDLFSIGRAVLNPAREPWGSATCWNFSESKKKPVWKELPIWQSAVSSWHMLISSTR